MIWSDKELASLSVMSVNEVVERFMSRLGEAENQEIFEKDNFSYLWGALGVAGIKGISHGLLDKVWKRVVEVDLRLKMSCKSFAVLSLV